jgi:ABC transport system ATP-binding/permease protein
MAIIQFQNVSLGFTHEALLDQVDLLIEPSERIAIIGRNGVGKSTLLKLIHGSLQPDHGKIQRTTHKISLMTQIPLNNLNITVSDALKEIINDQEEWQSQHKIDRLINQLKLEPNAVLKDLSGGQLRRTNLACALISEPDILLLDEPTNHLDLESIRWLESFLVNTRTTLILISHDRAFIQNVCNRFIEIDRGKIRTCNSDYQGFLKFRDQQLEAEKKQHALFDKKLSQEEVWIRQGIKARRTRNEGRVSALEKMREEHAKRRQETGNLSLNNKNVTLSGKQVFVAQDIAFKYEENTLFKNFTTIVQRGDKIGIIGKNGCGKSTLIRCLLGEIKPQEGNIKQGTKLKVAYFDQHRKQLDQDLTPIEIVSGGATHVDINGEPQHVISYLQNFLFTPLQSRTQISKLSGGEQNRLLLARLFAQSANLLILDEPTNDLDIESLELLEDYLLNFKGTILLITHDRAILNNVVTDSWTFNKDGTITCNVGPGTYALESLNQTKKSISTSMENSKKSGLSFDERKHLKKIPKQIEKLEERKNTLTQALAAFDYQKCNLDEMKKINEELSKVDNDLNTAYLTWEELINKESST